MLDDAGEPIADAQVLERLLSDGAVMIHRGAVESVDFATWRRQLRRAAREWDKRLSVRQLDDSRIRICDPDHVVSTARLRASIANLPVAAQDLLPRTEQPRRPQLRLVRD